MKKILSILMVHILVLGGLGAVAITIMIMLNCALSMMNCI